MDIDAKSSRDSPPIEKGQKDSMMSEKRTGAKITFENPAYDGIERKETKEHTYESVDNTVTTRYTTTRISSAEKVTSQL